MDFPALPPQPHLSARGSDRGDRGDAQRGLGCAVPAGGVRDAGGGPGAQARPREGETDFERGDARAGSGSARPRALYPEGYDVVSRFFAPGSAFRKIRRRARRTACWRPSSPSGWASGAQMLPGLSGPRRRHHDAHGGRPSEAHRPRADGDRRRVPGLGARSRSARGARSWQVVVARFDERALRALLAMRAPARALVRNAPAFRR